MNISVRLRSSGIPGYGAHIEVVVCPGVRHHCHNYRANHI